MPCHEQLTTFPVGSMWSLQAGGLTIIVLFFVAFWGFLLVPSHLSILPAFRFACECMNKLFRIIQSNTRGAMRDQERDIRELWESKKKTKKQKYALNHNHNADEVVRIHSFHSVSTLSLSRGRLGDAARERPDGCKGSHNLCRVSGHVRQIVCLTG